MDRLIIKRDLSIMSKLRVGLRQDHGVVPSRKEPCVGSSPASSPLMD